MFPCRQQPVREDGGSNTECECNEPGNIRIVALLLAHGADPNEGVRHAVVMNHPAIVKLTVEKQAFVNRRSEVGETLLKYAKDRGYREVAIILLNAGAHT